MTFSDFSHFALVMGALFAGLVVVAAWVIRYSAVPLSAKIALPALMMVAALYAPWPFAGMLGRAQPIELSALPDGAQILGVHMGAEDKRADIWIGEGAHTRLYQVAIPEHSKGSMRKALAALAVGDAAMVRQSGKGHPAGSYRDGSDGFGVDIRSRLPGKSGE